MKRKRHNWTYGCRECGGRDGEGMESQKREFIGVKSVPAGAKKEKRMPTNWWGGPIKKHQLDPIEQYRELLRQTESQQRPENPSRWTRVVCSDCGQWFASAASSCGTLCEFCPEVPSRACVR
jgi:hypothetical protein